MRYHAIVTGGTIPVYRISSCPSSEVIGELYNNEVFIDLGITTGYTNVHEVRFLNPSGKFTGGFIKSGTYENLMYHGVYSSIAQGKGYRFTSRKTLNIVNNSNTRIDTINAGEDEYTNSGIAGASDPQNMKIYAYKPANGTVIGVDGFVKLNYTYGSMFGSTFCLK